LIRQDPQLSHRVEQRKVLISRTAAYVAAARAIGAREPDDDVRNPDFLAEKFLGDTAAFDLDLPVMHALRQSYDDALQDVEVAGTVRAMIVRTRFIDAALERAMAEGARQLLVLGAGFDSHAYRFKSILEGVRVFEVDRAATLSLKKQRVREIFGELPAYVTFVEIDVRQDQLGEILIRNGYDFSARTFVIMEGLTMYLPEAEILETLQLLASHPAGSSVVFDFVSDVMIAMIKSINLPILPPPARAFAERFLHLTRDEPWEFGFPLHREREFIEAFGYEVPEILNIGSMEAARRYLTRRDGSEVAGDTMARIPRPDSDAARAQADAMAYRMVEAVVAQQH